MPSLIRVSFLFFQQGYGWSANWFLQQSTRDYDIALAKALVLAQKMQGIMGSNTWINGFRVSDESVFRDVYIKFYGTGNVGYPGLRGQSAAPQNCLIYKHNSVTLGGIPAYRPFRGLPVDSMVQGGLWVPPPGGPWEAANNAYLAQLAADAWGWRGATARQQQKVLNVVQGPGNLVTITLRAAMAGVPLNTDVTVSIARVKGASQVNGTRVGIFTNDTTFITNNPIAITPYTSNGTVLLSTKGFVQGAATGNWQRMAERKPGRPFYLSRGRRLVRHAG